MELDEELWTPIHLVCHDFRSSAEINSCLPGAGAAGQDTGADLCRFISHFLRHQRAALGASRDQNVGQSCI